MHGLAVQAPMRDRRGLVSLEYAVLAAAVVTAIFAGTGAVQQQLRAPFDHMETTGTGYSATARFNPF